MNPSISSGSPSSNKFTFLDEQLLSICEILDALACEGPGRLARLLWEARGLHHYTLDCIDRSPEEAEMHRRMEEKLCQMDTVLSQLLVEFLQAKDLLNDQHQIDLKPLKKRQIQAFLKRPKSSQ